MFSKSCNETIELCINVLNVNYILTGPITIRNQQNVLWEFSEFTREIMIFNSITDINEVRLRLNKYPTLTNEFKLSKGL
jgi:hypothetical protein